MVYTPTYHPDGRKVYDPSRTEHDIHDEWAAIEQRLRNEGVTCELTLHMRSREIWRQEEQNKEPWREWQQRVFFPRMRALAAERWDNGETTRGIGLTKPQLEWLIEHLEPVNHHHGRDILELLKTI